MDAIMIDAVRVTAPRRGLTVHPVGGLGALVERAADGDPAAWETLVERFTGLLWSVGRAHRLDDAATADVVQTTWLRLLENLHRIQDPERLPGWLVTTARRECLATLRRSGRESAGWSDEMFDAVPDADAEPLDTQLLLAERDAVLWSCFRGLSARCQALLRVLVSTDRPRYAEVSEALGLPIGSIGPTRMRCLARLRDLAADAGGLLDSAGPDQTDPPDARDARYRGDPR